MNNTDTILEFVDELGASGACDDCLSEQLEITPRQQVNQICNRLAKQGLIVREENPCSICEKRKIVNSLRLRRDKSLSRKEATAVHSGGSAQPENITSVDIEKIRTDIVRFCYQVWKSKKTEAVPRSISKTICVLRDENALPQHIANMMLTLCNIRNVFVYEGIALGPNEVKVASGAWEIVREWHDKQAKP